MKERREEIKKILEQSGEVTLAQLLVLFPSVGQMTLRRDLDYLQAVGVAFRTHGGARHVGYRVGEKTKIESKTEPDFISRANQNQIGKNIIAHKTLELIPDGSSIFLDSGTTAFTLAKFLKTHHLSIVTTGPNIALELAPKSNCNFTLLGGQLNRHNLTVAGALALDNLDKLDIDIAVMAASGYSAASGFSCGSYMEAEIKRKVLSKAKTKIMLADSSKYGGDMDFCFAGFGDINYLVTDKSVAEDILEAAERAWVRIV